MRSYLLAQLLLLFLLSLEAFAQTSPCENKTWIETPIVENSSDGSGIGGTGLVLPKTEPLSKNEGEDGIGGTGIVGVISGFGSICVNGLEIQYSEKTPIFEDGLPSSAKRLGLGQTVSILAKSNTQDYVAKEIHVLHEVQGSVELIDSENSFFKVLGQFVHLPKELLNKLEIGQNVAVSGSRLTDGSIEALRVERPLITEQVNLIGSVKMDLSNHLYIGNQQIELPHHTDEKLQVGDEVSVRGVVQNGVLQVESLKENPRLAFSPEVEKVFVQGYVRQGKEREVNIEGMRIVSNGNTSEMPKIGERAQVWVKANDEKQLIFEKLPSAPVLSEKTHVEPLHETEKPDLDKISRDQHETLEQEQREHENLEMLHHTVEIPNHIDMDMDADDKIKPYHVDTDIDADDKIRPIASEIKHPDVDDTISLKVGADKANKPDIEKPDIDKPRKIDIDKPEKIEPHHEIEHLDVDDKTTLSHPETNHPEIEKTHEVPRPETHHFDDLPHRK